VATVLREARARLNERMKAAETDEAPKLKAEAAKVKGELSNLAEAVATSGDAIPALVSKMTERQTRLTAIEARLAALHAAPRALSLEVKRLEKEISASLSDLKTVFSAGPEGARRFFERLLDGMLTFTPTDTWKGRRYRIEGKANLGGLVRLPQTLIVASPGGFEPPLAT
jgi:site-specific DNA recombinase